ncbi:(2Fe-2S)-binding protein [Pseudomonas sp. dw_358]|uniref:(2Fe-2S)-binding protein n=1 Tax=Pseudomonas sp. dw_358 TaxID=2720083 RepID=UPI001BD46896|nr:(2Fe-2S)-binding protein [Pseudomonas sp. dw_358]
MTPRFQRLDETERAPVRLKVDGQAIDALDGDTLMVALLTNTRSLRQSEFDDSSRAGFCLMGACQDCWVWTADGERLRACGTPVSEGLNVLTRPPEAPWNL